MPPKAPPTANADPALHLTSAPLNQLLWRSPGVRISQISMDIAVTPSQLVFSHRHGGYEPERYHDHRYHYSNQPILFEAGMESSYHSKPGAPGYMRSQLGAKLLQAVSGYTRCLI